MTIQFRPERLTEARRAVAYASGYWREELVTDILARNAVRYPEGLAVVDGERRLSWEALNRLSCRFALHLVQLGIDPGDAVALQLPNWAEYLICYFGIQLAGALVVQPGSDWREIETAYALRFGPARAVIIPAVFQSHDYQAMLRKLQPGLPELTHVLVARGLPLEGFVSLDKLLSDPIESRSDVGLLDNRRFAPDDVMRLVFTSGTTGLPKAIMHTNNTVGHSSRTLVSSFGHGPHDASLQYVPLSTNYGAIMGLHLPVDSRMPVVLMERFSASGGLALMEDERVTFVPGTPTGFIAFTAAARAREHDLSALRLMMSAGSAFPVPAIDALRERFSATFVESYGMNEFGMGFWCSPQDDPAEVDGTIGHPIPGLEACIFGSNGIALDVNEVGELAVKSAGMCCGYYENDEANASSWDEDGWFYTGDLAVSDQHGNFRIVGRSKDTIIRGGSNVSPREVEEALSAHPAVREVTVLGVPDPYYGEIVCACVIPVPNQALSLEEVLDFLEPKLARFKIPARLVLLDSFPLNSMGKVQKEALKDGLLREGRLKG